MEVRSRTLEWLSVPSLQADQLLVSPAFSVPCAAVFLSSPPQDLHSPTPRTPCPSVPVNRSSAHSWTLFSFLNPSSNEHSLHLRSFLDDPALLGLDLSLRPRTRGHFLPLRTQPPPPLSCLHAAFPRVGAGTSLVLRSYLPPGLEWKHLKGS